MKKLRAFIAWLQQIVFDMKHDHYFSFDFCLLDSEIQSLQYVGNYE